MLLLLLCSALRIMTVTAEFMSKKKMIKWYLPSQWKLIEPFVTGTKDENKC